MWQLRKTMSRKEGRNHTTELPAYNGLNASLSNTQNEKIDK